MHKCAAPPCKKDVDDDRLMCSRHWRMVSQATQQRIWRHYVRGQTALTASADYAAAMHDAVNEVRAAEGRRPIPRVQ